MNYSNGRGSMRKWIVLGVVALFLIIIGSFFISNYNSLVSVNNKVDSQWSQVENVMQARADKVNNLVQVVKGYVKHEEKVFGDIAAARTKLMSGASDVQGKLNADTSLTNSLKSLSVIVENYPNLKADTQFTNLQYEIAGSENRVAQERRRFIQDVQNYNAKVTRFPSNLFAKLYGFDKKEYFKSEGNTKINLEGVF
ncbi:MAG TPA: LemA family protein [Clostridia bacterium]|nr:LemA family protein [Clostridia bacterium]